MKTIACLLLPALLTAGCSDPKPENSLREIDIASAWKNPRTLTLDDLGNDIRIVPLETNENCLIGNNPYLQVGEKEIYVGAKDSPILRFSKKDGKLLGQIGRIGNGPGEYSRYSTTTFRVDEPAQRVYVWRGENRYQVYASDGTYREDLLIENDIMSRVPFSIWSVRISGDRLYGHNKTACPDNALQYICYDLANRVFTDSVAATGTLFPGRRERASRAVYRAAYGGPVYAYEYPGYDLGLIPGPDNTLWLSGRRVRIKDIYNDTIFTVVGGNRTEPYAVFRLGKHTPDYAKKILPNDEWKNKIFLTCVYETPDIFYFHFQTGHLFRENEQKHYCGVYRKSTGETVIAEGTRIGDERHRTPDLEIVGRTDAGELLAVVYPDRWLEWAEGRPDLPAGDRMKRIKEDDNPILVLIR